jgi:hypothetical protein
MGEAYATIRKNAFETLNIRLLFTGKRGEYGIYSEMAAPSLGLYE